MLDPELEALSRSGRHIANCAIHCLLVWKLNLDHAVAFAANWNRASKLVPGSLKRGGLAAKSKLGRYRSGALNFKGIRCLPIASHNQQWEQKDNRSHGSHNTVDTSQRPLQMVYEFTA